jgi:hypothetical protein
MWRCSMFLCADDVIWTPYQSSSGGRAVTSRHTLHVEGGVSMAVRRAILLNFYQKTCQSSKWSGFWKKITLQQLISQKEMKCEWSQFGHHTVRCGDDQNVIVSFCPPDLIQVRCLQNLNSTNLQHLWMWTTFSYNSICVFFLWTTVFSTPLWAFAVQHVLTEEHNIEEHANKRQG